MPPGTIGACISAQLFDQTRLLGRQRRVGMHGISPDARA
jgi:hypothetical protein